MDEGHRADSRLGARAEAAGAPVSLDGIEEDAQHAVPRLTLVLEMIAQTLGHGAHPLAHRQTGQDMIHKVGGGLCHAPGVTRGADAAALAGEGDEQIMAALVTAGAGESVG